MSAASPCATSSSDAVSGGFELTSSRLRVLATESIVRKLVLLSANSWATRAVSMTLLSPELASLRVREAGCSPPGGLFRSARSIWVTLRFVSAAFAGKTPKSLCQFVVSKIALPISWAVMLRPLWGLNVCLVSQNLVNVALSRREALQIAMVGQSIQHWAGAPRVRAPRLDVWFQCSPRANRASSAGCCQRQKGKKLHRE